MTRESDQTQQQVRVFFDREANRFPIVHEDKVPWSRRLGNALFRNSLRLRYERVMSECQDLKKSRVLDIGCGPGTYPIALAQAGAQSVVGIDFAARMIELARERASGAGVADRCQFLVSSLDEFNPDGTFEYVIAMGVMDYVEDAAVFVRRVAELTTSKALFSFPKQGGFLAWQRRLRYRRRCPLFMYTRADLDRLFGSLTGFTYAVESIARDWLVILQVADRT